MSDAALIIGLSVGLGALAAASGPAAIILKRRRAAIPKRPTQEASLKARLKEQVEQERSVGFPSKAPEEPEAPQGALSQEPVAAQAKPRVLAPGLRERLAHLFSRRQILEGTIEELEEILLSADVGYDVTLALSESLREQVKKGAVKVPGEMRQYLKSAMLGLLEVGDRELKLEGASKPVLWMVVGVNGSGKTTTAAKLAALVKNDGKSVLLAAADTFRAGAIEQLKTWAARLDVPVVAGEVGADPASVIFDAIASAKARGIDVVIADTAGRMHTRHNLMEELAKIGRVAQKASVEPAEVLLVLDATTGQNALRQAKEFSDAVPLTGIALTKLDGTAKGGIVFAVCSEFKLPVKVVGVGEGLSDLERFEPERYVEELLPEGGG